MQLSRAGHFTWAEWVAAFSGEITTSPQEEGEDINTAYYRQWMQALEKIVGLRGMTTDAEVAEYQEHWRRSYFHTEHGKPVEFRKGLAPIPPGRWKSSITSMTITTTNIATPVTTKRISVRLP